MIEIDEELLEKDLKKHTDDELKELLDFHFYLWERFKQEIKRRLINIKNNNMAKFIVYTESAEPHLVEHKLDSQTLEEKIHFAKQLIAKLPAIQIEFWHSDTRYTVEFEIQQTF